MEKQAPIRWRDDEANALLNAAVKYAHTHPGMSLTKVLNLAQAGVIATDRQRTLLSFRTFSKHRELVEQLRTPPPPPPPEIPVEIGIVRGDWRDYLKEMPTDALLEEAVCRIVDAVSARLGVSVMQATRVSLSQRGTEGRQTIPPSAPRRKRVVIVGLLRDQFRHVLDRVNVPVARWEVVFVDKDAKEKPPAADVVICQRHISHRNWDQAKTVADKVVFVDGGVKAVAEKLAEIFEHGTH